MLSINHLREDGLFGRQRCENHRPGSPQRRVQKPEVLRRPTPVTPYCDGSLHHTPDRRPAAKIRIRNDPPQPASQTIRTIRVRRGSRMPAKSSSEGVESAERTGLPNIRRQPLPKTAPAGRTTPPEILCHPRKNTVCVTSPPSEHSPSTPPEDSAGEPDNPFGDSLPPPQKYRLRDKPAFRTSAVLGENSACRADRRPEHPPPRGRAALRTVGRPPQLRLHDPENDEDPTRA